MRIQSIYPASLAAAIAIAGGCGTTDPDEARSSTTRTEIVPIATLENVEEDAVVTFTTEDPDRFVAEVQYLGESFSIQYSVDLAGDPAWVDLLGEQTLDVVNLATGDTLHLATQPDDPDNLDWYHPDFVLQVVADGALFEVSGVDSDPEGVGAGLPDDPSIHALLMVAELPWQLVFIPDGEADAATAEYGEGVTQDARGRWRDARGRFARKPKPPPTTPPSKPKPPVQRPKATRTAKIAATWAVIGFALGKFWGNSYDCVMGTCEVSNCIVGVNCNSECGGDADCRHDDCRGGMCTTIMEPGSNRCSANADCQHLECDNGTCTTVNSPGSDTCSSDSDCRHAECNSGNGMCEEVMSSGVDLCGADTDCFHTACSSSGTCDRVNSPGTSNCTTDADCTHAACSGGTCTTVNSPGSDECSSDADCQHKECSGNTCTTVDGPGADSCTTDDDCDDGSGTGGSGTGGSGTGGSGTGGSGTGGSGTGGSGTGGSGTGGSGS